MATFETGFDTSKSIRDLIPRFERIQQALTFIAVDGRNALRSVLLMPDLNEQPYNVFSDVGGSDLSKLPPVFSKDSETTVETRLGQLHRAA